MVKKDIKDFNLPELAKLLENIGYEPFRARQLFSWIYKKGVNEFDLMLNLPKGLREKLSKHFYIFSSQLSERIKSQDSTEKFLFKLKNSQFIESVVIPTQNRITGCISSQVGCKFACSFCASGMNGFKRDLTCGEILEQVLYLRKHLKERRLTHIVFMGIGEPLDNYDNVIKVVRIINSPDAFNIAARRITISTCGIIPGIKRLAKEKLQIELSISLHAADDITRNRLLPVNKKYPLKDLIEACRDYIRKTGRQITFEYVLLKNINSDLQNAKKLCRILKDLKLCKVNLIPANPLDELGIEPADKSVILKFRQALIKSGAIATLRKPRGQDIGAACGQLRLGYEKK